MFEQIHARSEIMHQALDGLAARQRATAHNLANADTPGYKAQDVSFEAAIKRKLAARQGLELDLSRTDARHLSMFGPEDRGYQLSELSGRMRNDHNGVDLEQEMTRMAHAQMSYTAVSQQLAGSYSSLKYVISEGGR